jgi:Protein  of unknown function (DUF3018)
MASSAERVRQHRQSLRLAGLRPVQLWVPDTRKAEFAAECKRQSRLVRDDPHDIEIVDWANRIADRDGWR